MKIAFIEPSPVESNVYSKLHMPLLGPLYLGAILKQRGHQVSIFNENIYRPDYSKLDADLIGISILTSTSKRGYEIAKKFPKEKVIIGGVHASLLPEESLQYARQVVIGEAEEVIADIVEGRMKDPIVRGREVKNLDSLPQPDFSLVKGYKIPAMIMPVSTSRGCPFDCSFCSVTKLFGRNYRFRSAQSVMQELLTRRTGTLFFCDDNFTAHPKRTEELLKLMMENKINNWTCQARCDVAKNDKLLNMMVRAGCTTVCVGFESVNNKTLEAYHKKQTIEDIIKAIKSFHRKKIKIHGMFILGADQDSAKTVWETLKFAIKQKIDTIQMSILTPFPGTKICEELEREKRIFSRDWSLYDGQHIVFKPKLLSARELQLNVVRAYAKFYSLSNSLALLLGLRLRNAFFRFMGNRIVKKWVAHNRKMQWILQG
ncbi:MAG: B12-binding domain-containing radical SAM protein [Candidatus Omnitrophica bacterium]|jgi:radical SAM superfamily enzyme YgiQ (UPF0313 family)|nr:B12-binding domain-containing radical SAM protein [Candidatus Omnitrophota bacterium]